MNDSDGLLTVRQLRDLLQVDRITIYRMLWDGRLQGFKVGGQWRFSRQAIESWLQEQKASLGPPLAPAGADDLAPSPAALPLSCVSAIQDILAQALDVGVVTVAADGAPLTPVAHCREFCDLILQSSVGRQRCIASWRRALAQRSPAPRPATCHAGLRYLWAWIHVQGSPVAAACAGQYLLRAPADPAPAGLDQLAAACGLSAGELQGAFQRLPVFAEDREEQLSRLLGRMVATFTEIGEERFRLLGRLQRIAEMTQL